jgi:hypothetical protein
VGPCDAGPQRREYPDLLNARCYFVFSNNNSGRAPSCGPSLIDGPLKPLFGLVFVPLNATPPAIKFSNFGLCFGKALFGGLPEPIEGLFMTLLDAQAIAENNPEIVLRSVVPRIGCFFE